MLITNEKNACRGIYQKDNMWTSLLIGEINSSSSEISIQITHIEPNGKQDLHSHPEDQCYYILNGKGVMHIGNESQNVFCGDAVFIPGNSVHGIVNIDDHEKLSYLTANKAFGRELESKIWNNQ
jgi:quercetin dioxygenase-like cupin family protein